MTRPLMTDTASLVRIPLARGRYRSEPDLEDQEVIYTGLCSIQPFMGIEDEIDRDTRTSQCRLIADEAGWLVATAMDYIEDSDGTLWKIDGKPFVWTLRGRHHIELNMRLVEG